MLHIFIDGDGCSVKEEVYKVATRYKLFVTVVANSYVKIPNDSKVSMEVVAHGPDAADDWIVEKVEPGDIVITTDIPLADRCIKKQARVLGPKGKELSEENIGNALATRELMTHLRSIGEGKGGPAPMAKKDKSQFLSELDRMIHSIKKNQV